MCMYRVLVPSGLPVVLRLVWWMVGCGRMSILVIIIIIIIIIMCLVLLNYSSCRNDVIVYCYNAIVLVIMMIT